MGYTQPHPAPTTMSGTWWAMVLRGIVAVLFGSAALLWPELTLFVLLVCFGVYALIDGLLAIVAGIRASEGRRWLLLAEGAIGCLAGLVTWCGSSGSTRSSSASRWSCLVYSTGIIPNQTQARSGKGGASEPVRVRNASEARARGEEDG